MNTKNHTVLFFVFLILAVACIIGAIKNPELKGLLFLFCIICSIGAGLFLDDVLDPGCREFENVPEGQSFTLLKVVDDEFFLILFKNKKYLIRDIYFKTHPHNFVEGREYRRDGYEALLL
jgi:hypothetical protein